MFTDDSLERHQRSRVFTGRIVELQSAAWLEMRGWSITGLEALRPGPDIEASRDDQPHAIEVKAIGRQDEAFEAMLKSLRNEGVLRWMSPDGAINYLLFRAYECGKQLSDRVSRRVAILSIEELAWHDFRVQLQEGWINWAQPRFLGDDPDWTEFLLLQEVRYPAIREELASVVTSLDEIWIVQRLFTYECRLELTITPKAAAAAI